MVRAFTEHDLDTIDPAPIAEHVAIVELAPGVYVRASDLYDGSRWTPRDLTPAERAEHERWSS